MLFLRTQCKAVMLVFFTLGVCSTVSTGFERRLAGLTLSAHHESGGKKNITLVPQLKEIPCPTPHVPENQPTTIAKMESEGSEWWTDWQQAWRRPPSIRGKTRRRRVLGTVRWQNGDPGTLTEFSFIFQLVDRCFIPPFPLSPCHPPAAHHPPFPLVSWHSAFEH